MIATISDSSLILPTKAYVRKDNGTSSVKEFLDILV
jgi:hypothetical protein